MAMSQLLDTQIALQVMKVGILSKTGIGPKVTKTPYYSPEMRISGYT